MKTTLSALALVAALGLSTFAQAQPSGGPDAKGNAPLKAPHTVNDGQAKHGANSFTQGQAQTHIEKAGFTGVSGLAKGQDGVWRGTAMRDGQSVDVAMDFKGNVSTSGGPVTSRSSKTTRAMSPAAMADPSAAPMGAMPSDTTSTTTTTTDMAARPDRHRMRHHRHHRRHHVSAACAAAMKAGAACSGVDKNDNGVSDKEDRMHGH